MKSYPSAEDDLFRFIANIFLLAENLFPVDFHTHDKNLHRPDVSH